jgi:hypothetical protein
MVWQAILGNIATTVAGSVVSSALGGKSKPRQAAVPKFSKKTPNTIYGIRDVETSRAAGEGFQPSVRTGDSGSAQRLADVHADAMEGVRAPTSTRTSSSLRV